MLLLLVMPAAVSIYLQVCTVMVQHEMKERLEKEELITVFVQNNQVKLYGKHEMLIEGRMFDVKSITIVANGIRVTGLFDSDEDAIRQKVQHLEGHADKEQKAKVYAFLHLVFHPARGWTFNPHTPGSNLTASVYKAVICDNTYPVIVPPPQVNSI